MRKTSRRDEVVNGILQGLQEAVAFKRGESKTARVTVLEVESVLEAREELTAVQPRVANSANCQVAQLESTCRRDV
jgi:hypothetical protein